MGTDKKICIVLADDQPIIRQGLRYIINFQEDMCVVGEADNGKAVIDIARESMPDVILMDIQMPGTSGIDATRTIHSFNSEIKVVLLTTFDVQEYVYDGIRAGAVGYLLKDTDTKDLLDGIRWVYQGQAIYRTAKASQAITDVITRGSGFLNENNAQPELPDPLTDREIEVLQLMSYGRRNSESADILYISLGTVKTHVHRIIQKLGVEERTQAVVFAIRNNIVK
jgi:DNA-binding NarL/FixJ family response regulator